MAKKDKNLDCIQHTNGDYVLYAEHCTRMNKQAMGFENERTAMMKEIDDLREQLWKPPYGNQMLFNVKTVEEEEMTVVLPPLKKGQKITVHYE